MAATSRRAAGRSDAAAITELGTAAAEGTWRSSSSVGGQSAGLIGELLSVAEVVGMLVTEAEEALAAGGRPRQLIQEPSV